MLGTSVYLAQWSLGSDSALGKFLDNLASWMHHSYLILNLRKIKASCWASGAMVMSRASSPLCHR